MVNARDQQGAAEQERENNDGEFSYERDEPEATFVSEESPYLDLNVFAAELTAVLEKHHDDDVDHDVDGGEHPDDTDEAWAAYGGAPPGAPPAYRAAEANAMAAEEPSDDEIPPEPPKRPRYATGAFDDEAAEGR